jgi:hypothetical protein
MNAQSRTVRAAAPRAAISNLEVEADNLEYVLQNWAAEHFNLEVNSLYVLRKLGLPLYCHWRPKR